MSDLRFLPAKAKHAVKRGLKQTARTIGYDIVKYHAEPLAQQAHPQDFTPLHLSILSDVRPYTLTSPERIFSLIEAVTHVAKRRIPGAIVECGVWRGGSMMATALTLLNMNCADRELYLFDTFEGMPKPQDVDIHASGSAAMTEFVQEQRGEDSSAVCYASLGEVKAAMASTKYDPQWVHFVRERWKIPFRGKRPNRSRCFASIRTGKNRPATNSSTFTRGCPRGES